MLYFRKAGSSRISDTTPTMTKTMTKKDKYKDKDEDKDNDKDKVLKRPITCYIFKKLGVQGYQI